MNGWNNWDKGDQDLNLGNQALSFFNNEPKTLDKAAPEEVEPQCTDSNQCGSGYSCVGGQCVSSNGTPAGGTLAPSFPTTIVPGSPSPGAPTGGSPSSSPGTVYPPTGAGYPARDGSGVGGGGTSGCGQDTDPGSGNNTVSPCGPNPSNNGCTKTGCGRDNQNANDCCGEQRCCRYSGAGVQCRCGPCPPGEKPCNVWCDITKSATGDLWPGCEDEDICDECSECGVASKCTPNTFDAPCQCEQSACNATGCEVCGDDGICRKDCDNCQTIWTRNYQCPCGTVTQTCRRSACDPGLTHCTVPDCSGLCADAPGPCEGSCSTTTICDGSEFFCPSYASCSVAGTINTASAECTIYNVCDKRNLPPECEECDCNCEDDCPDCQICNSQGECEPDPACGDKEMLLILRWSHPEYLIGNDLCNAPGLFNTYGGCDCYEDMSNQGCTGGNGGGTYTKKEADVTEYKISFGLKAGDTFKFDAEDLGGYFQNIYCKSTLYGEWETVFMLRNARMYLSINGRRYNGWLPYGNPAVCKQATAGITERLPVTFSWRQVTEEEWAASDAIYKQTGAP